MLLIFRFLQQNIFKNLFSNFFLYFLKKQQQSQTIVSSAATSIVVNSITHTAPIQATQTSVATPPVASVAPVPSNATPANQVRTHVRIQVDLILQYIIHST